MTTIELTPAEVAAWADVPEGNTFWIVRKGDWRWVTVDYDGESAPPAEFVQACAPCETCDSERFLAGVPREPSAPWPACLSCRIELVESCGECDGAGSVDGDCDADTDDAETALCVFCDGLGFAILGHAYAVGQPLPIVRLSLDHGNIGCIAVDPASGTVWAGGKIITAALAHYGPSESLVGQFAVELRRA